MIVMTVKQVTIMFLVVELTTKLNDTKNSNFFFFLAPQNSFENAKSGAKPKETQTHSNDNFLMDDELRCGEVLKVGYSHKKACGGFDGVLRKVGWFMM